MKVALFDIFTGIAGDMTIAALIDAGADFNYLKQEIGKLGLEGFSLELSDKMRSQINAKKFDVIIHNKPHYHTHLADINKIIESSGLSDIVKVNAKRIFEVIGVAEAKIHNIPIEKIHFHEVGAIDSIVDIVGACICIENLGIEKIYTTPVRLGKGLIKTQHGVMPNPAPATLEILKDYPVEFTDINFELTTPTGAAIVKTLSSGIYRNDDLSGGKIKIKNIGFGSGTFDIPELPNLFRVIICEIDESGIRDTEKLIQIETNIDDMNPQIYPYVMDKLFEIGVRDVYYQNVVMKKGRPGILLSVLTEESLLDKSLEIIYSETTTIGVRINRIERHKLEREIYELESSMGKIRVKAIKLNGSYIKYVPEFEDCKKIALAAGKPLNTIYRQLMWELNV
jgi:uncharacterized protein (TIGR00299 family) protein